MMSPIHEIMSEWTPPEYSDWTKPFQFRTASKLQTEMARVYTNMSNVPYVNIISFLLDNTEHLIKTNEPFVPIPDCLDFSSDLEKVTGKGLAY